MCASAFDLFMGYRTVSRWKERLGEKMRSECESVENSGAEESNLGISQSA